MRPVGHLNEAATKRFTKFLFRSKYPSIRPSVRECILKDEMLSVLREEFHIDRDQTYDMPPCSFVEVH
jgi:hypothetical protein